MAAKAKERAKEQSQQRLLLSVSFWLALFRSSISLLDTVYVILFPFGAIAKFSDRESSPDPSRSYGSLALLFARST